MDIKNLFKRSVKQTGDLPMPFNSSRNGFITGIGMGNLYSLNTNRLPGSLKAWKNICGDLDLNSIVTIAMDYYIRNFPQCPVRYMRKDNELVAKPMEASVINLLQNPTTNAPYSVFWGWIIKDYKILGNAFLRKIRVDGEVVALQYLPGDSVRPYGNKDNGLIHWIYNVEGKDYVISLKDIIHFRYGRDVNDFRLGRSPISSVLREIATDNAAASTSYGLMANNAMPAIILGPDANDATVDISEDDARTVKKRLMQDFAGDNAGGVAVMTGPFKLERASWSPEEMNLEQLRRLPEERIVAALGLNVMVLGLGAGLDHSTYSNYERAQQAAWEDGIVPLLKQLAEVLTQSLIYEFPEYKVGDYIEYDLSEVRALADDVEAASKRAERLFLAGIIDKSEAKIICKLKVLPGDVGSYYEGPARPLNEKSGKEFAKQIAEEILNTPINKDSIN
jgi:HK97 family phage portal protein